jgi:hypothetical protein
MVLRLPSSGSMAGERRRETPRRWREPDIGGGGGRPRAPGGTGWLWRLAWFIGLWVASVTALGLVSLAIKLAIGN